MKEQVYVDRLFADYENTPEIKDFKEEITANLKERIKELLSEGLDEEKAFDKATAELGDITTIDDVGKKKRNEAICQMYTKTRVPLTKKTAAGLTIASGLLLVSVGLTLFTVLNKANDTTMYSISVALFSVACGMYTYFGLTQETIACYAMKSGRALMYGIACLMGFLGSGLVVVSHLCEGLEISTALGFKLALVLLAICTLILLLATESKRHKPWLKATIEREIENTIMFHLDMVDPVKAVKFELISGGLWILAIAMCITLGFAIGWKYSWLIFLFSLAAQTFMVTMIINKKK